MASSPVNSSAMHDSTTFEQFNEIRELFIARLMRRGYKRKFINRMVRQCNYFLLKEQYCKPIDYQARISKYRVKLLIDYRASATSMEGALHIWWPQSSSLYSKPVATLRFYVATRLQNLQLYPTRKMSCQAANGCSTGGCGSKQHI